MNEETRRLFDVARRLSSERPPGWTYQGCRWPSIAHQVGFKPGGNLVHFGSGAQLAFHSRRLVEEAAAGILEVKEAGFWSRAGRLARSLAAFFRHHPENPAMLWTFTICWTDQGDARIRMNGDVEVLHRAPPTLQPFASSVCLRFDPNSLDGGVWFDTADWLPPEGIGRNEAVPCLVTELRRWTREGETLSGSFRQQASLAGMGREYVSWLQKGACPVFYGKVYSMYFDRDVDQFIIQKDDIQQDAPNTPIAVPGGLFNVNILKAWRLFERAKGWGAPNERDVMLDELIVSFDRESARTLSATASRNRYSTVTGEKVALVGGIVDSHGV